MHGINNRARYTAFDHTADLGVEIYGDTPESMFENATFALFDLITDIHAVEVRELKSIYVEGDDRADLLVNYLREILYLWNGEGFVVKGCRMENMSERLLNGTVEGEPFDPQRHTIKTEIKAVTYHGLSVAHTNLGWVGRVIFDV